MKPKSIKIVDITIDAGTQSRVKLSQETIDDYADRIQDGKEFPPVELMSDGISYWPTDGFHRVLATQKAGLATVKAIVSTGTLQDAVVKAASANANHGLQRSNADKRKAVKMLLAIPEWAKKSDRVIAETADVSHPFVAAVRKEIDDASTITTGNISNSEPDSIGNISNSRQGRDGKMRTVQSTQPSKGSAVRDFFDNKEVEAETAKPASSKGSTKEQNPAILVDELQRSCVSPLVRGIDNVAKANGGKGPRHEQANDAINGLIDALKGMRKGEQ